MREEYEAWTSNLKQSKDSKYWDNLIKYLPYIVEDMAYLKQHILAKKLNMSPNALSILKPLILATHNTLRS